MEAQFPLGKCLRGAMKAGPDPAGVYQEGTALLFHSHSLSARLPLVLLLVEGGDIATYFEDLK